MIIKTNKNNTIDLFSRLEYVILFKKTNNSLLGAICKNFYNFAKSIINIYYKGVFEGKMSGTL